MEVSMKNAIAFAAVFLAALAMTVVFSEAAWAG
jgi:hypothetical protein